MIHPLRFIDGKMTNVLKGRCFSKQVSNPKKTTKRLGVWWFLNCCLWLPLSSLAGETAPRFVSLTLCSDRLLMALARPAQIAAMSPFSTQSQSMLGQINTDKPVVRPRLSDLLAYADATIFVNERFYPQLLARLKKLGFRVVGINDNPQTPDELFTLVQQLAALTGNADKARALLAQIQTTEATLRRQTRGQAPRSALALTENGLLKTTLPQHQVLFDLLNLYPVDGLAEAVPQISAEQLLLANPQVLLRFSFSTAYSQGSQWLKHPALTTMMQGRVQAHTAAKYTFCFDHGVWQGAADLMPQLQ